MKKTLLFIAAMAATVLANAQFKDDFESNKMGWSEFIAKDGEATIKEGKLHLIGKKEISSNISSNDKPSFSSTYCYAPFDFNKNFSIKAKVFAKKIDDENNFGIMFNYIDEYNFCAFSITEDYVKFYRYKEGRLVGFNRNGAKTKNLKKNDVNLEIKSTFNKVEFYINNVKVIQQKYVPMESTGIGFYVLGKGVADFDDLEITQ